MPCEGARPAPDSRQHGPSGPIDNSFQQAVEADLADVIKRDGAEFFNAMIPLGRHGTPEEVAQSVLYLASDESRFTTGSRLMIDGGMSA